MLKSLRLIAVLSTAAVSGIVCLMPSTAWARGGGGHSGSHGGSVHVHGYYRSNGTYVSPYFRSAPNSGEEVEPTTGTSYGGSDVNIPDSTGGSYVQQGTVTSASETASPTVTPKDTEIVEKPLPKARTMYEQLDSKAEDAEAVIKDTPDPSTSEMLAVLAGNPPIGTDVCHLPYSALTIAIYQRCIQEGMSYVQVSNTIGWAGEETASSGSALEYTWKEGDKGIMRAVFEDNRLISKSQVGLK